MRYALDVRVRNAAIAEGLAKHQCTQAKLAEMMGVQHGQLNAYATLRECPWAADGGSLKPAAKKMAAFLGVSDSECFPPELYAHFVKRRSSRALIYAEAKMLPLEAAKRLPADTDPEREVVAKELKQQVAESLSMLTPRQADVICMRFGLVGEQKTYEETGQVIGCSRERVRQIEAFALRKLRHPNHNRKLKAFV